MAELALPTKLPASTTVVVHGPEEVRNAASTASAPGTADGTAITDSFDGSKVGVEPEHRPDPDAPLVLDDGRTVAFGGDPKQLEAMANLGATVIQNLKNAVGPHWRQVGKAAAFALHGNPKQTVYNSGRPQNILAIPGKPGEFYVAGADSGVEWTKGGQKWRSLSNRTLSTLGDIAVHPTKGNVIYAGDGDPFSNASTGLSRSKDSGKTWSAPVTLQGSYPGTREPVVATATRSLQVSPDNTNMVFSATNVGLFRSTKGLKGFELLAVPPEPTWGVPFAKGGGPRGFWSIERLGKNSWTASARELDSKGVRRGVVLTTHDNGATWERATLPEGLLATPGRITLRVAESTVGTEKPVVYALVGSAAGDKTVDILRSDDGGKTFRGLGINETSKPTNPSRNQPDGNILHDQAWYNQALAVDPENPDVFVAMGNLAAILSVDGGKTYKNISDWLPRNKDNYAHADGHLAAFLRGADGKKYLVLGNDGGFNVTLADPLLKGKAPKWSSTWNEGRYDTLNQSVAIRKDFKGPIVTGLQDNGTVVINPATGESIQRIGGDGFDTIATRGGDNRTHLYGLVNGTHVDSVDGKGVDWNVAEDGNADSVGPFDGRYAEIAGNTDTVMTVNEKSDGSGQVLVRTGQQPWVDNTGNITLLDGSVVTEIPGTVRAAASSRSDANIRGVVTDEGFMYVTRDGGKNWSQSTAVTGKGTQLPFETIDKMEFDPSDKTGNTFWVASGSGWGQFNEVPGTEKAYLFKTTDAGKSFLPVSEGNGPHQLPNVPANVIRVDPSNPKNLYVGNVFGVYRSSDGGATWNRFGQGMPIVDVTDLLVSDDGTKLLASTYGHGLMQLDMPKTRHAPGALAGLLGT